MDGQAHDMANEALEAVVGEIVEESGEEMTDEEWKQIQSSRKHYWLYPYQFKKGQVANPGGRPKGMSMKHFAREYLSKMTLKERIAFMSSLDPYDIWRMAEGNPSEDKNIQISVPKPILGGLTQGAGEAIEGVDKPLSIDEGIPPHAPHPEV
jgi:hypothetical protein